MCQRRRRTRRNSPSDVAPAVFARKARPLTSHERRSPRCADLLAEEQVLTSVNNTAMNRDRANAGGAVGPVNSTNGIADDAPITPAGPATSAARSRHRNGSRISAPASAHRDQRRRAESSAIARMGTCAPDREHPVQARSHGALWRVERMQSMEPHGYLKSMRNISVRWTQ